MKVVFIVAVLAIGFLAYIRLAPSDPERWHVDPLTAQKPKSRGVLWNVPATRPLALELLQLDAIARSHPRTRVLAGSVESGHITYVTRSKWFGFPDYITVKATQSELVILSRLRFGWGDAGVNKARLRGWLKRLEAVDN